mmetsp:Transcript_3254/g.14739  ORF Transcript_3254/g.14739 Transcript_3254/m.14739 type:complete len:214 (+) Transcript_3254:1983-2624(+)
MRRSRTRGRGAARCFREATTRHRGGASLASRGSRTNGRWRVARRLRSRPSRRSAGRRRRRLRWMWTRSRRMRRRTSPAGMKSKRKRGDGSTSTTTTTTTSTSPNGRCRRSRSSTPSDVGPSSQLRRGFLRRLRPRRRKRKKRKKFPFPPPRRRMLEHPRCTRRSARRLTRCARYRRHRPRLRPKLAIVPTPSRRLARRSSVRNERSGSSSSSA